MANDLHDALTTLAPTPWSAVPLDSLPSYLHNAFTAGELICNSVPPPPAGEPFHTARPHHKRPNAAKSAKDVHVSLARSSPPHESHEALQKHWGKPYKFSAASNPHGVSLYKMAGHDRHGAWFARRSVHEGIGFSKFRRAMQREFPHTLTVEGGPGAGAIRGLAADQRLEDTKVEGVGHLEVYLLSGQMPKPVTPRDFLQLLMNSPDTLTEKSASQIDGVEGRHVPRSYMIVSKPVQYPDAPERSGFVRGQYESVEMIREIPLHRRNAAQSTPNLLDTHAEEAPHGRKRGATVGFADEQQHAHTSEAEEEHDEAELNPVEWIMVTRSDPGGGIPRFLVDRGTPDAMLGDIGKFLDWAAGQDDVADSELKSREAPESTASKDAGSIPNAQAEAAEQPASAPEPAAETGGMMAAAAAGVSAYTPAVVSTTLNDYLHPTHAPSTAARDESEEVTSDSSSDISFMSANEIRRLSTAPQYPPGEDEHGSIRSATSSLEEVGKMNTHDKEVQKLMQQREKLDRKLAKKREEEQAKMQKAKEKDRSEEDKQRERHEKEMLKAEQRHKRELEKLEAKKTKESRKAEEKRRKKDEQTKLNLVIRERDESRSQLDITKRENRLLLERMEELQKENTALAARLGKFSPEVLKEVQGEGAGRKRSSSVRSTRSEGRKSRESVDEKKG